MPRLLSRLLLSLWIASPMSAVTMDWTPVGNPGNACDPQSQGCFGAVPYSYSIGTYEVTNAQYAEFLNAKAESDPLGLYENNMSPLNGAYGGISRSGSDGNFVYSVVPGRGDMPVNYVSLFDAMRFANWMNNGQGEADTETGAYTLLGNLEYPSNELTVTRNAVATIVLTSQDEWTKAAFYDAVSSSYFDYPLGSNGVPTCATPTTASSSANCNLVVGNLTPVGSYTGSASPYGTFDQGGNVWEWTETISGLQGVTWGGAFPISAVALGGYSQPVARSGQRDRGFRLVMVPEPGTGLLVAAGLLSLAGWRRSRA